VTWLSTTRPVGLLPVSKRAGTSVENQRLTPPLSSVATKQEATMPTTNRSPLISLGWQTWSILAVVLALVLVAAAYLMLR
jgi:hypothetical protein